MCSGERRSLSLNRQAEQAMWFSCTFWLVSWCERCDGLKVMGQEQSVNVSGLRGDPSEFAMWPKYNLVQSSYHSLYQVKTMNWSCVCY